jgi:hypothetical protein
MGAAGTKVYRSVAGTQFAKSLMKSLDNSLQRQHPACYP